MFHNLSNSLSNNYNNIQITDFDDDIIGLAKSFIETLQTLNYLLSNKHVTEIINNITFPFNYIKIHPHFPKMEYRKNYRKLLKYAMRFQEKSIPYNIVLQNIYITIIAGIQLYHMPLYEMLEMSKNTTKEYSREEILELLLKDGMSPNWIKEPSGKDFTNLLQ